MPTAQGFAVAFGASLTLVCFARSTETALRSAFRPGERYLPET